MIRVPLRGRPLALTIGALLLLAACSSGAKARTEPHASSTAPTSTGTTLPGQSATLRATPERAVQALLAAEQRGNHLTSYRLLSPAGRSRYPHLSDWEQRRAEMPAIIAFAVTGRPHTGSSSRSADVHVEVQHKPGLDPFVGLSAAHERQTWVGRRQGSGWLVDPDPSVFYEFPPADQATTAALSWARAVQQCDKAAAGRLQAVADLYGSSAGTTRLCRSTGAVRAGQLGPLQAGPSSADLIAQYSTDALAWARVVPVTAPSGHFSVIVAPLGEMWKIVGLTD